MQKFLRALSPIDEFIIVVVAAFGSFIAINILTVLQAAPKASGAYGQISESDFAFLLLFELLVLMLLATFLHARGWTLERVGLGPNLKETISGIALVAVTEFVASVIWVVVTLPSPKLQQAEETFSVLSGPFSPALVVAVSVVNPIFEETFLCGYMLSALKERTHWWIPVALSVGVRTLCHLYQGPVGLTFVVPLGIIFACWYLRQGRLWPLIVAHVAFDFIPLFWYGRG